MFNCRICRLLEQGRNGKNENGPNRANAVSEVDGLNHRQLLLSRIWIPVSTGMTRTEHQRSSILSADFEIAASSLRLPRKDSVESSPRRPLDEPGRTQGQF